jgi:hypothetical protein
MGEETVRPEIQATDRFDKCPDCGEERIESRLVTQEFKLADPTAEGGLVQIRVPKIKEFHCPACTFTWTDYMAEGLRTNAVTNYLWDRVKKLFSENERLKTENDMLRHPEQ